MTMMTRADIRTELGWTDDMIHSLLQSPDSPNARRSKNTGEYTYGLYKRERVLAAAQSTEGRVAKRQRDERLRGYPSRVRPVSIPSPDRADDDTT
jgi:hypothetical protein